MRRLYPICLRRRLEMQLGEIGRALDESGWDLEPAMQRHLALLDHRLAVSGRLRGRVGQLLIALGDERPPTTRRFLDTMQEMVTLGADSIHRTRDGTVVHAEVHAGASTATRR